MTEQTNSPVTGSPLVKRGLADMLKGGVIMDVVTPEQAKIAEDAGAVAVMALERVPADIRALSSPKRKRIMYWRKSKVKATLFRKASPWKNCNK